MSHTEGKLIAWDRGIGFEIHDENGNELNNEFRGTFSEENARRLVDCWNACEGLPQDALDGGWTAAGLSKYAKKLETERDELLAVLREIRDDGGQFDLALCKKIDAILSRHQEE